MIKLAKREALIPLFSAICRLGMGNESTKLFLMTCSSPKLEPLVFLTTSSNGLPVRTENSILAMKSQFSVNLNSSHQFEEELGGRRFRRDLYDRLCGYPIRTPALRERPTDIPILIQRYFPIFSVAAFALQRDRTYVVITLIVLTTLSYSLLGGAL